MADYRKKGSTSTPTTTCSDSAGSDGSDVMIRLTQMPTTSTKESAAKAKPANTQGRAPTASGMSDRLYKPKGALWKQGDAESADHHESIERILNFDRKRPTHARSDSSDEISFPDQQVLRRLSNLVTDTKKAKAQLPPKIRLRRHSMEGPLQPFDVMQLKLEATKRGSAGTPGQAKDFGVPLYIEPKQIAHPWI